MKNLNLGFAFCGSFCSFEKVIKELQKLVEKGANITPIMSFNAAELSTRFGTALGFIEQIEKITKNTMIKTIEGAEPIGPKKMFDLLVIAPCTGNTLAKLANGITDTPVTMAAKSHLRNGSPVLIALATNDGLAASMINIARLMNTKNIFFVPYSQDEPYQKPHSLVSDFTQLEPAIEAAVIHKQIKPISC